MFNKFLCLLLLPIFFLNDLQAQNIEFVKKNNSINNIPYSPPSSDKSLIIDPVQTNSTICGTQTNDWNKKSRKENIQTDSSNKGKLLRMNIAGVSGWTTSDVPFWMRSNQYGSIPISGPSFSLIGKFSKDYSTYSNKVFDWGFGFELRTNVGNRKEASIIEAYAKLKVGPLQLKAGRSKETMGIADDSLGSGAFSISGNALGIPKVEVSIPNYYYLPVFDKLFAVKGSYAHGWLGNVELYKAKIESVETFFHQKSLYIQLGKEHWKLKLTGGINHQAFYGNSSKFRPGFNLSPFEEYKYVVLGRAYIDSKIGNHLGSIDLGLKYNFNSFTVSFYRQNFYDVGALGHLANLRDGLHGITFINKKDPKSNFFVKRAVLEYFTSKNQAGAWSSKPTPSGNENYFNSSVYKEGWSYQGLNLGSPFITSKKFARTSLPSASSQYFVNNRIHLMHLGFMSKFKKIDFATKISYSLNFGTYVTSPEGGRGASGSKIPPSQNPFPRVNQLSAYLEASKSFGNYKIGSSLAFDHGELLNNAVGLLFKVSKELR